MRTETKDVLGQARLCGTWSPRPVPSSSPSELSESLQRTRPFPAVQGTSRRTDSFAAFLVFISFSIAASLMCEGRDGSAFMPHSWQRRSGRVVRDVMWPRQAEGAEGVTTARIGCCPGTTPWRTDIPGRTGRLQRDGGCMKEVNGRGRRHKGGNEGLREAKWGTERTWKR